MNPELNHDTDKDLGALLKAHDKRRFARQFRRARRPFLTAIVAIGLAYGYYLHVVHVQLKDLAREAAEAQAKADRGAFERAAILHNAILDTIPGRTVAWGHEITKIPVVTASK